MSSTASDTEVARDAMIGQFTSVNTTFRKPVSPSNWGSRPSVVVEVPNIQNEDEYKLLPAHPETNSVSEIFEVEEESDNDPFEYSHQRDDIAAGIRRSRRKRHARTRQSLIEPASIVLSDDDDMPSVRRPRRSTRNMGAQSRRYRQVNEDTASNTSSAPTRQSRRLISQVQIASEESSSDDELENTLPRKGRRTSGRTTITRHMVKGTRSSQRRRTKPGNFAERLEDDIPHADASSSGSKYSLAKEHFEKVPKDDPFRLRHRGTCSSCRQKDDDKTKGPLVFCQGCTSSYHRECLGPRSARVHLVTKISSGVFILQCRRCLGTANEKDPLSPHQGRCTHCNEPGAWSSPLRTRLTARQEHQHRENNDGQDAITDVDMSTVDSVDNIMFRCSICERAWHAEHLPPKRSQPSYVEDSEEDQDTRFKEYSCRWKCNECLKMPGEIETMVAWRPVDLDSYVPGSSSDMLEEIKKEYLIKWRKLSYFRTSWMPGAWVWAVAAAPTRKAFHKSPKSGRPVVTTEDAIPEEYLQIDIIFDVQYSNVVSNRTQAIDMARVKEVNNVYAKYKGLSYEDAVWEEPPRSQDTERWRSFQTAYEDFVLGRYLRVPKSYSLKKHLSAVRARDFGTHHVKHKQPSILTGQLMDYQRDGLNWLYFKWYKEQNAILADEMGLGKTIQVIALFATLIQDHNCWPFLVVVPNSTCQNWRNEVKAWAPSLHVVTYYGTAAARKLAHDYELFPDGESDIKAHIVVTSYEAMIDDQVKRTLSKPRIPWAGLVVDEGHRLKNDKNQLYETLSKIGFPYKVLLTGTPLQNNVRELFNILQFCDPSKNAEELELQYQDLSNESVAALHDMIRPFFLRRTKAQVLAFLPPLAQVIVPVSMTVVQKKLYKSILAKNPQLIKAVFNNSGGLKKAERQNLNNILMQLRKCLCHPFVYSKAIEEKDVNASLLHRNLVEASSKLQLLEILLPKLQERGHRVLIFSQFLDFLDIIEDFLDGLGLLHLRLDGSVSSLQKQKKMDQYNAPNSPYFAFLLSTRAGGLGINLATADTVIIMDPDFNPHQDIQALSRAHRIGQQKKVLVFQLMTRDSAEEKIMQVGRKKMALDHVLIDRMDAEEDAGEDLESILRHGTRALFDDDNSGDLQYNAQSVEGLLDRSHAENTRTGNDASAESQFSFARVWTNNSTLEDNLASSESATATPNDSLWEKILQQRERAAAEEARARAENLGRGKRKRQTINYTLPHTPSRANGKHKEDTDDDFQAAEQDVGSTDIDSQDGNVSEDLSNDTQQTRPYKRATVPPLAAGVDGANDDSDITPGPQLQRCPVCVEFHKAGYCRLKLAGVEHCGLCGIAHFGHSRTCPHLHSETQVAAMLGSLKQSPEPRAFVDEATKYLRGIRGDLVRRKKNKANRERPAGNAYLGGAEPHPPRGQTPGIPYPTQTYPPQPIPRNPYASYYPPLRQQYEPQYQG